MPNARLHKGLKRLLAFVLAGVYCLLFSLSVYAEPAVMAETAVVEAAQTAETAETAETEADKTAEGG